MRTTSRPIGNPRTAPTRRRRPIGAGRFSRSVLALVVLAALLSFSPVIPQPAVLAQSGNPVVTLGTVPGPTGNPIETGTAVFDGLGECGGAAPAAPPVPYPGNDCGPGDNVVRTNDIVSFGTSIAVSNLLGPGDPGGPEYVDDVYFTQTITPSGPDADIEFVQLPFACRTGTNPDTGNPYTPQSAIVSDGAGGWTITCNIGRLTGPTQTIFMRTEVRVNATSKNEASFTATDEICPDASVGCTVVTENPDITGVDTNDLKDDSTTYISALPRYDAAKNKYGPNYIGPIERINDPNDPDDNEPGITYRYYFTVEVDATTDGKGSMALTSDPITFDDIVYVQGTNTTVPNYELQSHWTNGGSTTYCFWNNHGGRPIPYGKPGGSRTLVNSTPNSGDWACAQPGGPGTPIEVSITGADTSGSTFPDTGSNNSTALTPPYYVLSGWMYLWFPYEDIDRYDPSAACDAADAAAGYSAPFCGEVDNSGDLPITNCVANFDPDATDADGNPLSNYGDGVEPGTYGEPGGNNCRNTTLQLRNTGSYSKYFTRFVSSSGGLGGYVNGQTYYHSGNGPIEPNQYFSSWARYNNTGTLAQPGAGVCEKIDNITYSLAPIQSGGAWVPQVGGQTAPAFARTTLEYPADQGYLTIEYASGPAGTPPTGAVPWDNDHLNGGLDPLSGLYNGSTYNNQRSSGCTDAEGNWTSDPYSFDADPTTSLGKIRAIRVVMPDGTPLVAGNRLALQLQLQARNTFNGGPYDGQLIPAGTIVPNMSAWRTDNRNGGVWNGTVYNPNTDSSSDGDRLIFSRGFVRLEKHLVPYNTPWDEVDPADYDATQTDLAGEPFQFRLQPAAISNTDPASGNMTNVTVTDVLPAELTYDPVCTAAVSAYGPPIIQPNTPNPGETTLIWNLGTVVPNTQLDPIDFCVDSDPLAPDGTSAVNTAIIASDEDTSTDAQRSGSATVLLAQIGEFRMAKRVDTSLDPEDNPQEYTVEWLNSSDFVTLDAPVSIDVFPHLLDGPTEGSGAPRSPESDFTGTVELNGAATASVAGDFLYTKRAAVDIQGDPAHATNPFQSAPYDLSNPNLGPLPDIDDDGEADSGATVWCLDTDFGTPGCPASYAEATGLMFVATDEVGPGQMGDYTFRLDALGNDSGDFYANRASGFTPSLPGQVNQTNTVVVEVVSLSLGDFVWFDYDDDGTYDPGQGEIPVPDGVVIELRDGVTGAPLGPTTTTVNGRYLFEDLVEGSYVVAIPATEFIAGGLLEDFVPSTPFSPSDDDANEDLDQNGYQGAGGVVLTDPVTLAFNTGPPDPITGDVVVTGTEPIGDDVAGVDFFSLDELSNLTVDIGLVGPAEIDLVKDVLDDDANTTPGIYVPTGDPVSWTYTVANTGDVDLFTVTVTDDQVAAADISCPTHLADTDGNNVIDILRVGDIVVCTASGTAIDGQYTNTGDVIGTTPTGGTAEDDDPANYYGFETGIDIEKTTNGDDADTTSGPQIGSGGAVTWTYTVTNTGNVDLAQVAVTDDIVAATEIDCGGTGSNIIALLAPGATNAVTCVATGSAAPDQYENTGTATGNPVDADGDDLPGLTDPTADDPSHYYGIAPSVDIEKDTNGDDADTTTGPLVPVGDPVTWTYVVENDGNVPLTAVTVGDDQLAATAISCDPINSDAGGDNVIDLLLPKQTVTCTATGTATLGEYENNSDVVATPAFPTDGATDYDPTDPGSWPADAADYTDVPGAGNQVDADPSHYWGFDGVPGIDIEKSTNTLDSDLPSGSFIITGGGVAWHYDVTNTGDFALAGVAVTDSVIPDSDIVCPAHNSDVGGDNIIDILLPDETVTCVAIGTAIIVPPDGQYSNRADTSGNPVFPVDPPPGFDPGDPSTYPTDAADYVDAPGEPDPTDADLSHYFSADPADPAIDVEKDTNGFQADDPPGPYLDAGDAITWTFVVENLGGYTLAPVTVVDDQLAAAAISCEAHHDDAGGDNVIDLMFPGDRVTCTATGSASTVGQYANVVSVIGDPVTPVGCTCVPGDYTTWPTDPSSYQPAEDADGEPLPPTTEADPSHYFGAEPGITLEKDTNGDDADTPTGPFITSGDPVTWTYVVENTGNTPLGAVTVTDDQVAAADITCPASLADTGGDNVIDILLPGEIVSCIATDVAVGGQYANESDVTGNPVYPTNPGPDFDAADSTTYPTNPADYADIAWAADQIDDDPSHYYGYGAAIDIEKDTNGDDADATSGPFIDQGDTVTWTYVVRNTGNLALADVAMLDDQLPATAISCPAVNGDFDGNNVIALLLPDQSVTCTATAPAGTVGVYENTVQTTGNPVYPSAPGPGFDPDDPATYPTDPNAYDDVPGIPAPTDDDPSHYFGADPSVMLEKATNGIDADTPTGPFLAVGDAVTWTYTVTNDGNVPLTGVAVTDDIVAAADISCAASLADAGGDNVIDVLMPDEVVICTATGVATDGQYANVGDVTGQPAFPTAPGPGFDPADPATYPTDPAGYDDITDPATGDPIAAEEADDPSHYYAFDAAITLEKATNGVDADSPTGPFVDQGDTVTWTYTVSNTGNVPLANATVTDNVVAAADISCAASILDADGDNVIDVLLPTEVVVCTATAPADTVGQYANIGDVSGDPVFPTAPGPDFDPDDPTTYPTDPGDYAAVPDPTTGDPLPSATADDPSHYFGADPSVTLDKATNGDDADTPTGPFVDQGDTVTWTYTVTNDGNVPLAAITVTDDVVDAADISCAASLADAGGDNVIDVLMPTEVVVCTATAPADTVGQYANIGDVTGQPAFPTAPGPDFDPADPATYPTDPAGYDDITDPATGDPLPPQEADDPSHYFGADPSVNLQKATNGADADTPTGVGIPIGSTVTWTYTVTNDGNVPLTGVAVTDDIVAAADISCAASLADAGGDNVIDVLMPGEFVLCTATGVATAGQYANIGDVTGQPAFPTAPGPDFDPADPTTYPTDPAGYDDITDPATGDPLPPEEDDDPSHYFGADPGLGVQKATNGADADFPTGPAVAVGDPVTWTYTITNDSNTAFAPATVTDDQLSAADISCAALHGDPGGDNVIDLMLPGDAVVCTATGVATAGQYANTVTVSGQPVFPIAPGPDFDPADPATYPADPTAYEPPIDPDTGLPVPPIDVVDPSHYIGVEPGVSIQKFVNGADANTSPGINIDNGTDVVWTYVVTNTGDTALVNVTVADDKGVPVDCGDGTQVIALLVPGEQVTCTGEGVVEPGPYANVGIVGGTPAFPTDPGPLFDPTDPTSWPTDPAAYDPVLNPTTGNPIPGPTDSDPAHHFGNGPAIDLVKEICSLDNPADCDPTDDSHWVDSKLHLDGTTQVWRIVVTNTGNVDLTDVDVSDPLIPACATVVGDLAAGESVTITCESAIDTAPFENTATATGSGPTGQPVDADDRATLTPPPELVITKSVDDAVVQTGDTVTYTIVVTNVGEGDATGTVAVDQLPVGLVFQSVVTVGADVVHDPSTNTLTWTIGDLASGGEATLSYRATATSASGSLDNTIVVSADQSEPVGTLDDNTAVAQISIVQPPAPPPPPTPPRSGPPIAFTGASTLIVVSVALMLLLLGGAFVTVGRRRREN